MQAACKVIQFRHLVEVDESLQKPGVSQHLKRGLPVVIDLLAVAGGYALRLDTLKHTHSLHYQLYARWRVLHGLHYGDVL